MIGHLLLGLARPGGGAVTLALLFGMSNLIYGVWILVLGIQLRQTRKTLHSVSERRKEKKAA